MDSDEIRVICAKCIATPCSVVRHLRGATIDEPSCPCECHAKLRENKYIEEAEPKHEVGNKW